jgi:hypothetical protein
MKLTGNSLPTAAAFLIAAAYMYNLDWPQALSTPLQSPPHNYSLNLIVYLYIFPNVAVVLFIIKLGNIMDNISIQKSAFTITLVSFISQLIIAITYQFYYNGAYKTVMIFRIIFVICGQMQFPLLSMILRNLYM